MVLASGRMASPPPDISIKDLKTHCLNCSLRELCLPVGLTADEMHQVDALIVNRTKLSKNETLYRVGEPFRALYAIRVGSLKTQMLVEDGREQVARLSYAG
jgi:CRP/FNR family transcriptional regulator